MAATRPSFRHRMVSLLEERAGLSVRTSKGAYNRDGLFTKFNHDFVDDPEFARVYESATLRARRSGLSSFGQWRVHTALWAASSAYKRSGGAFAECGVNFGVISHAIAEYCDWNASPRPFYLFDTFEGRDHEALASSEKTEGFEAKVGAEANYLNDYDGTVQHFSKWEGIQVVKGSVPDVLEQFSNERFAFAHLDTNSAIPDSEACAFFLDRLDPGGMILVDDYGWPRYHETKRLVDIVARDRNVSVLHLPTGQGLLTK